MKISEQYNNSGAGTLPITQTASKKQSLVFVIASASAGTLIEFYDLILAIVLAPVISRNLFPEGEARFLETLAIIVTSYFVRPIGALLFGSIGDSAGRKKPFLVSLLMMGTATFLIGCIPTFETIGWMAPVLLLILRLLQGLAISGEYTGATIYVAEHAPENKRGFYTGFIQSTIPLALLLCLGVLFTTQRSMTPEDFSTYGWRIPFLFSAVLVLLSYFIRRKLGETPKYALLQTQGKISHQPVRESFQTKGNIKTMLLLIFGGCGAQSTLMQTTHFVMLFFLQRVVFLSFDTTLLVIGMATLLGCPFFQLSGALSDKVGRKKIMLTGLLLSAVLVPLVFYFILQQANPQQLKEVHTISTMVMAKLIVLILSLHICCAMVYGPLGAFILESFPARIRFTSMGFVYNIGNGVLGGSTTFIAELFRSIFIASTAFSLFAGLIYPLLLILTAGIVLAFFIPETYRNRI
ncbi:MHS family MFS transporter [Rhodocytophaga rosea]|uniref:MHS family MFS transporter n=1 Tax=Rhodocytophaga rosea TaxID=2704465 RepID=A0A6C0GLF8_9BACT|nr:MFS transporter [Rhodocytophaga rosea]QHT68777.1 MHS family MFS transporter [Rhodocytophaga rosea]